MSPEADHAAVSDTHVATTPVANGQEHVLDESGHFHVEDEPIHLERYYFEAWIAFGFFWVLAITIFYQFFTRYALNDSAAWTEEIARYLLICTVFVAIAAAVRLDRHIHVDLLYRYLPAPVCRVLSTLVDVVRIAFFAYAVVLTFQMMQKMGNYKMTIVELPMNIVYGVCLVGFAFCAVRSVQVAIENWRRGYSVLERPEIAIEETLEERG
jgi:TRAP-type C4-dicarboxylate transport system permease small subunit